MYKRILFMRRCANRIFPYTAPEHNATASEKNCFGHIIFPGKVNGKIPRRKEFFWTY
jgi:hypothetical protein